MKKSSVIGVTPFPDAFNLGYVSRWNRFFRGIAKFFQETVNNFKDTSGLSFWQEWIKLVYVMGEEDAVRVLRSRLVKRCKTDA